MSRVFISHNHVDDAFADKLVGFLKQHRIDTFVDHLHITPGEHWPSKVQNMLKACDSMIAVISDYSVNSRNCTDEWDYFLDWKGTAPKEIIPVRLSGDDTYFRLSSFHFIDVRKGESEAFETILSRIGDQKIEQPDDVPPQQIDADQPLPAQLLERYPLARRAARAIGIATGNIAEIAGADVLINSENDHLRLDVATVHPQRSRRSVSAAIHSFGASWNDQGKLVEDTVARELRAAIDERGLKPPVPIGTVIDSGSGSLTNIGVRRILHVVSLHGKRSPERLIDVGTPIQLARCTANALKYMEDLNRTMFANNPLRTVIFPIFGTGRGGIAFKDVAPALITRAIDFLEYEESLIETVYFVAYKQKALNALRKMLGSIPDLFQP